MNKTKTQLLKIFTSNTNLLSTLVENIIFNYIDISVSGSLLSYSRSIKGILESSTFYKNDQLFNGNQQVDFYKNSHSESLESSTLYTTLGFFNTDNSCVNSLSNLNFDNIIAIKAPHGGILENLYTTSYNNLDLSSSGGITFNFQVYLYKNNELFNGNQQVDFYQSSKLIPTSLKASRSVIKNVLSNTWTTVSNTDNNIFINAGDHIVLVYQISTLGEITTNIVDQNLNATLQLNIKTC